MSDRAPVTETVRFSKAVYGLETIKKAAYRFLDRFSVDILSEEEAWVCALTFSGSVSRDGALRIIEDFRKELLDQDLRGIVSGETVAIRNAILALAFTPLKIQNDE